MIIKGKAQAQPGRLAKHLCRTDQNERVRILQIEGLNGLTIADALREIDDLGAAAETRRTMYHGIIATRKDEQLTDEERNIAVRRMAEKMGLQNQPYIVVGHLKKHQTQHEGEHYHVIWSRIDQEHGRGISDSHNYRKHEELARDLEGEFGHARTRGAHTRDKSQEARPGRTPSHGEMQQAQRTGVTVDQAKQIITAAWKQTRTGAEFVDELSQAGFTVARGDRRDFVLVDQAGGIHGLTRRVDGAKAKDIRERMGDVDLDDLPGVDQAKRRQRELREAAEIERGREILSAAERQRNDELGRERDARGNRARLETSDREIAAALRGLAKTGTVTNVVGVPVRSRQVERIEPARLEPVRAAAPAVPAPPAESPAERRESIMEKLDREARERGDAPIVVKIVPTQEMERRRVLKLDLPRPGRQDEPRP